MTTVRIVEPKPSNNSACTSASPPSVTLMPGGSPFITGSVLIAAIALESAAPPTRSASSVACLGDHGG